VRATRDNHRDIETHLAILFMHLRLSAPRVLEALRACSSPESIADWALVHHLDSPCIRQYAEHLLRDWVAHPAQAERLQPLFPALDLAGTTGSPPVILGPDFSCESKRSFLRRCAAAYDAQRPPRRSQRPAIRPQEWDRHCLWFVALQINDLGPTAIADRADVTPAAVDRATRDVASRLGLERRRFRPGRQKRLHIFKSADTVTT
jgi:hypothetical protein